MCDMNVVELAPGVSPASDLINSPIAIQMMQARVSIGLQGTGEVFQVLARVFARAICRVREPYGRGLRLCRGPIIANISPETAGSGLPVARRKHRDRRIVGVNLRASQNMLPDLVYQRRNQRKRVKFPS